MAFLDNSGDIILDAVLTDAGRKRLARGDGTFKVTKYAFGDDEIDYSSYNANHDSGSAYTDLEILQTPILEAFTNNRSSLKSRLITLTNNNLLYLPQLVLNERYDRTERLNLAGFSSGSFLVSVNAATGIDLNDKEATQGMFIVGDAPSDTSKSNYIRIDQGLITDKLDGMKQLSSELMEQQYMIQIDNRFGSIVDINESEQGSPAFIDDDQIATYYVTRGVGSYVSLCATGQITDPQGDSYVGAFDGDAEIITGPRGTKLEFSILASSNLQNSEYLFDTVGNGTIEDTVATKETYKVLDTTVKVTGVTTGYSIDVPVRFIRETGVVTP